MNLTETHKIPATYAHWSNQTDPRDWEVIGIKKTLLTNGCGTVNLFDYLDQNALARVGFIRDLWISIDEQADFQVLLEIITARGLYNTVSWRPWGNYKIGINSPTCSIIVHDIPCIFPHKKQIFLSDPPRCSTNFFMWFDYLPKTAYDHYSLGQDSLIDSGPAAGYDMPPKYGVRV
jgi:hypothetical protein